MSTSTTDFDDAGPALPELDALARHAAATLRTTAAGFDLAPPTRSRTPRLLGVAAAVLLALLVAAVAVVVRHDHDDRQRTVTGPGAHLFPSYVPRGLRFTGAYDPSAGTATDPGLTTSTLGLAQVYASDDDARVVAALTVTDANGSSNLDEAPGEHLTVGGQPAVWQAIGGLLALGVQIDTGRVATYYSRGLTRAQLIAVATSAAEHGVVPPAPLPSLPPGLTSLGQVTAPTVLHGLTLFAQLDAEVQRALGWQAPGLRTLSIVELPGDERTLRIGRLLARDVGKVEVDGQDGWAMDVGGLFGVRSHSKMAEVTWLEGDTQVVVDGMGLSRADVVRVARSVRPLSADAYRAKVEALGGMLGALEPGVVVLAQGGPPADVAAWRVTARVTKDGEELCLQRRAGSGCSGQSTSVTGAGSAPSPREPVDLLQLDRSGPPVVLMGSVASDVATLRVNGKVVRPGGPFGSGGRRGFAVAEPSTTTSVTILALDRTGGELFRRVVSFGDPADDPSTTVVASGGSPVGSPTTAPR